MENEMKLVSSLAAVRERIAEALKTAKPWLPQPDHHAIGEEHMAEDVVWLVNALEAVLDAAPCVADIGTPRTNWIDCEQSIRVHGPGLGQVSHGFEPPAWLEAALTRATATTEGAR